MHPIILIPARMASERLPGKPLLMVGDAPMIVQVWRRAAQAKIGEVAVACDGEEIAGAVAKAGGKAIITDPSLPSGSDRVYAALKIIDPGGRHDAVINLQGDMPTIDPAVIKEAMALLDNAAVDIATLVSPFVNEQEKQDAAVVKAVLERNTGARHGRALSFSRAWPATGGDDTFQHIGLYAYRRAALEKFVQLPPSPLEKREKLEQLRALEAGMRIEAAIVGSAPVGVDTPQTLEQARQAYEHSVR